MLKMKFFGLLLVIAISGLGVYGQVPVSQVSKRGEPAKTASAFFPLSEVKEGLRGTARTVFRGSEPEDFTVEILGVVPSGIGPRQDMIVGRIVAGGPADRTAVFAGMSGSPVYIDGRLVGALSYSFPFSKEPICGITPIEQMIAIFEQKQPAKVGSEPRAVSFAELASTNWQPNLPKMPVSGALIPGGPQNSALMAVAGQSFQPIATPMTFTGFSQQTLDLFAPQLMQAGLLPVSAVGGAAKIAPMKKADDTTLRGGASVSMQLSRGDYSLAASGTVTYRDGEKIYAFGHPFLGLGTSDLPMSESHVVIVVPSLNNSFKLAVPDEMVGSMTQDRATGVYGSLGQAPRMIPVRLNVQTSRGQTETFNYEVVRDDFLTPILINLTLYNSIVSQERGLGETTIAVTGEIKIKGNDPVMIERRFAGGFANQLASSSVAVPVSALLKSNFDDLEISEIVMNVVSTDGGNDATLERIALDRSRVKAGETVEVQAFARTDGGKTFVQKIPVTIPADTPAGTLSLTVGDGAAIQQNAAIQQFVPKNLNELIKTINNVKLPDRLYVQLFRTTNGAIIGANELTSLPPSVLATLNSDRTAGGFKSSTQTVLGDQVIAPANFIISGQQTLQIEVVR